MSDQERDELNETQDLDPNRMGRDRAQGNPSNAAHDASFSFEGRFLEPVANIGRYVDLQKLGQGSFGVVFRAQDDVLKRFVALKLLTQFKNAGQVDAWVGEARVLASLDHPAIVPVYDIGKTEQGQPYIVSKLIDGGSLAERSASKSWSIEDTVRVVCQLSHALDYLHHQGVMHRDIKPSNILTTASGDAVLADFGLALPESGYGKGARFVGTPAYMSPEQARHEGHRVDGRSDIYSLGVVLYELLAGTRPFRAKDQEELLDCIRNVEVRPLRQLNAEVPKELERICLKMLSKKVSDRYATAADLSDDLEDWRTTSIHMVRTKDATQSVGSLSGDGTGSTVPPVSTRSLDIGTIAVVPHGLRPFDAGDADFFKYLLPGARDRDGVPDSMSFWVNRILSRDPTAAFRVGVLLGPSGSGKSSLMRAGILPMVSDQVTTIYVEAKPEQLEENLLKQIRRAVPKLANAKSLRECLIQVRQNGNDRRGNKLLLVIDQFEQWLNYHRDSQSTELHESLRQCDGSNVQAILLVRDDFMLGISSFMDQIEELLLQNQNFATVEPFGVVHARNVLAAFGRAYGTLSDPLTSDQSAFLTEATNGLEQIGRLEPVQIALLSEMIKSKPWTPTTLKELGGIQGLGVSFLEERLAGASAHPILRTHLPVVRRILTELLPTDDTVIKPPACAQSVMLERLEGIASEETLRKLLSLIDTEVRLITPTSNASTTSSSSSGSSISDPAYQLTHDYLVPTTRKWLASLDIGSRTGRARQQLREISSAWNAKPTTKRLPSLTEWINIRWFTSPNEWTNSERRMMQSASRRLVQFSVLGMASLVALLGIGYFTYYDIRSRFLATRLVEADTSDVVSILNEIEPMGNWVLPKLAAIDTSKMEDDPRIEQRKQLHIGLALADRQPERAVEVFEKLDTIDDRNLASVIGFLRSRKSLDDSQLFEITQHALHQHQANALPLVALLCQRLPEHAEWPHLASGTCELLLRKPSTQIGFWPELLLPIRSHLLPELLRIGEQASRTGLGASETAVSLVSAFSNDDASNIARAVGWAPIDQLSTLLTANVSSNRLATELRQQLSLSRVALHPTPERVQDAGLEHLLDSYGGRVTDACAWADQLPWNRLNECLDAMRARGYKPNSIRPYLSKDTLQAAVTWRKDAGEYVIATELNESDLLDRFSQLQDSGFSMVDFSEYSLPGLSNEDPVIRWVGLWHKEPISNSTQQVLLVNEVGLMRSSSERMKKLAGLVQIRHSVRTDSQGDLVHHSLWTSSESEEPESVEWTRVEFASGDLFPGYCQTDISCENIGLTKDRSRIWTEYYDIDAGTAAPKKRTARETVNLTTRLSACGKPAEALEMLLQITDADFSKVPETERAAVRRGAQRQQARALARLGKKEELRTLLDESISKGKFTQEEIDFLYLRLSMIEDDTQTTRERIALLQSAAERTALGRDYYLRSLAIIASKDIADGFSEMAMQKLIAFVTQWIAKEQFAKEMGAIDFLLDIDFDGIRSRPDWQRLLDRCKLSKRFSSCASLCDGLESKVLLAEPISEHQRSVERLHSEGFLPACLDVHADAQNKLFASSVWHRRRVTSEEIAANARRTAIYALALAKFGETDAVIDGLGDKWGRSVQTAIIALAPNVLSTDTLVMMLRSASGIPLQSAIVSALGSFPASEFSESNLRYLRLRLNDWAESAPQVQLKNMSRWCLQNWNEQVTSQPTSQPVSENRNWFTNSLRQQLIVLDPPELVLVGKAQERRIWVNIGRRFAISATEVTGAEFEDFLNDPRVKEWIGENRRERAVTLAEADMPQAGVSWQLAMRYCQWLNERENVMENHWCYRDAWTNTGNSLPSESAYLERNGYRLPTQAEWEWACGGGQNEAWHFGSDESLIKYFEWTLPQSNGKMQAVAKLRPNQLGLFDIGGSLAEWTDDGMKSFRRPNDKSFFSDSGNSDTTSLTYRVVHGGRYKQTAVSAITNSWVYNAADYISRTVGFRIARTISKN